MSKIFEGHCKILALSLSVVITNTASTSARIIRVAELQTGNPPTSASFFHKPFAGQEALVQKYKGRVRDLFSLDDVADESIKQPDRASKIKPWNEDEKKTIFGEC